MVLQENDCYQFMLRGSIFQKVKSNVSGKEKGPTAQLQETLSSVNAKRLARTFKLDTSHNFISWYPSRKGQRYAQYEVRRLAKVKRGLISMSSNQNHNDHEDSESSYQRHGFTIIFTNGTTCELLGSNAETVSYWVTGLRFLIYRSQQVMNSHLAPEKERFIRTEFKAKSMGAQNLDFHSAIELFHDLTPLARCLNLQWTLNKVFKHAKVISCNDFVSLYDNVTSVGVLLSVMFQYSIAGDLVLTVSELTAVLANEVSEIAYGVANESVLMNFCRNVVSTYETVPEYKQNLLLGIDGLTAFFFSRHCSILDPRHLSVHQDMSKSLSCYFINSSHNTFLKGSQLLGESCAEMYSTLLMQGVRYVEIDVWDGEDGQPFCNHGYTLTSRIPFTHVIQAINQSAFLTSVYPVIIALENHSSLTQQTSLVQTMSSIFREKLFLPKENSPSGINVMDLPLSSLCGKILIKSKKLSKSVASAMTQSKSDGQLKSKAMSDSNKFSTYDDNSWGEVSDENSADELHDMYKIQPSLKRNHLNEIIEDLGPYDQRRKQHLLQGKSPTIALSSKLSKCVALRSSDLNKHTLRKLHASLVVAKQQGSPSKYKPKSLSNCCIYNLPENQAVHVVREQYLELFTFTQSNLVCVSPSPNRIDSSNPELLQFWNGGIQIVALNQQTEDRVNKMNRSLFESNGSCGYFLKPKLLQLDVLNENHEFCCTKTISISFLYMSVVDQLKSFEREQLDQSDDSSDIPSFQSEFCLRVEVQGHPIDTSTRCFSCKSKQQMLEGIRNLRLEYPELAFMSFSLLDELSQSRKALSDCFLPVSSLAHGLRSISLSGTLPVSLLCSVRVEEHIQASKQSQLSLGFMKRAAIIKKSIKSSFRKSTLNPHHYDIPATLSENGDRSLETVSDRDSGFLSNSSMNSPSRLDRNGSPGTSAISQSTSVNFGREMQTSERSAVYANSEQDRLNIMLEEAAKAEVLLSAEHRKAKSMSMTEESLPSNFDDRTNLAPPPKRYQSFRDKSFGEKGDSIRHSSSTRKELPQRPTSLVSERSLTQTNPTQAPYRKTSGGFLYTVASPASDALYKVIEESSMSEDANDKASSGPKLESGAAGSQRNEPVQFKRHRPQGAQFGTASGAMTGSLNRSFAKNRSGQKSKYINSTAIQRASADYNNMAMNLESSVAVKKGPPIPPKTFTHDANPMVRPRSLHRFLDPSTTFSLADSFSTSLCENKSESELLNLTTSALPDYSSGSSTLDDSNSREHSWKFESNCSADSPDLSVREGVLNLHEMSISLPVESRSSSSAVKKSLKTLNQSSS